MQNNDFLIQAKEDLKQEINSFVENQDYHHLVTPLKSLDAVKVDQRKSLEDAVYNNFAVTAIEKALGLIQRDLSQVASPDETARVMKELQNSDQVFFDFAEKYVEKNPQYEGSLQEEFSLDKDPEGSVQEAFGISNETLITLYQLGSYYLELERIEDAKNIMGMLLYLASDVSNFWAGVGVCFQKSGDMQSALEYFRMGSMMNEELPACALYAAECHLFLHDKENAKEQLIIAERRIESLSQEEEKKSWLAKLNNIKKQL